MIESLLVAFAGGVLGGVVAASVAGPVRRYFWWLRPHVGAFDRDLTYPLPVPPRWAQFLSRRVRREADGFRAVNDRRAAWYAQHPDAAAYAGVQRGSAPTLIASNSATAPQCGQNT